MDEPIGGDECVACQSRIVTEFAPDCYECCNCSFTWGDGLQAYAARQRRAKLDELPDDERRQFALAELQEADQRLMAADAALANACNQLGMDLLAGGDMYSRTRNESVLQGAGEMGTAHQHINNAAEAVRYPIRSPGEQIDINAAVFVLDVNLASMIADLAGHQQAERLRHQAWEMRRSVAHALHHLTHTSFEIPAKATKKKAGKKKRAKNKAAKAREGSPQK